WLVQWSYPCTGAEGHVLCLDAQIQLFWTDGSHVTFQKHRHYKAKDYLLKGNIKPAGNTIVPMSSSLCSSNANTHTKPRASNYITFSNTANRKPG
ncbi:hypothetical protein E2I00_014516, partial [Balaenoptera physalus]